MAASSIPIPPVPSQQRIRSALAAMFATLAALGAMLVGACNDPDTVVNDPNDQLGRVLDRWADDVHRGDR